MKRWLLNILLIIFAGCLSGCGDDSSKELDQKELVYAYERLACMDEKQGDVMDYAVAGEDLYYYCGGYTMTEESMGEEYITPRFYKCKTDGSQCKELAIKWDEEDFDWIHSMEVVSPDAIWLVFSSYSEEIMTNTYILQKVTEDGEVLKEIDLNDYMDVEEAYISDMKADTEGKLYVNTGYSVLLFDPDGKFEGAVETQEMTEHLLCAKDGSVYAGFAYEKGYTLTKIDPEKIAFGESYNTRLSYYDITVHAGDSVYDFYYRCGEMLYGYDVVTGEQKEILHFMASGMNTEQLGRVQTVSEGLMLAEYREGDLDQEKETLQELYLLHKIDPKEIKPRRIVTYASRYPDSEVKKQALVFNQSQDKYLVVVKDYQNSENPEMDLYKDLQSGEVIDLVDLSGMASDKYIAQEMFVDLHKYMKRDKEIQKEDFSENILAVLETDGKLYHISPFVGMNGVISKKTESGKEQRFYRETKETMLSMILEMNYDSYMDWKSGSCFFDSDEFIAALEYANTYDDSDTNLWEKYPDSLTETVRGKEAFSVMHYALTPADLQLYEKMYEEEIAVSGMDYGTHSEAALSLERDFAICASSSDKKGAWAFLKTFLTREYAYGDPEDMIRIPVRKDSLEDKIQRYTATEAYTDILGNEITPIRAEWGYEELEIDMKPLSGQQETLFREIVQSLDHKYVYDYDVISMVTEEAEPYFEGDMTAKEAAANIQKRVSVYMADYSKEE